MKFTWIVVDKTLHSWGKPNWIRQGYILSDNEIFLEYYDALTHEIVRRYKQVNYGRLKEIRYKVKISDLEKIDRYPNTESWFPGSVLT